MRKRLKRPDIFLNIIFAFRLIPFSPRFLNSRNLLLLLYAYGNSKGHLVVLLGSAAL